MNNETSESAPQSRFKVWYDRHAATFNEARRDKYRTDGALREKARLQAAKYRQSVKETGKLPELRHGLYTVSRLAAVLRVSAQTVRNWEVRGMIPKANHPGKHRLYSPEQVLLLQQLIKIPQETEDDRIKFDHFHTEVFRRWYE